MDHDCLRDLLGEMVRLPFAPRLCEIEYCDLRSEEVAVAL